MNLTDWIGFLGVTLLLIAFGLNLKNILHQKSLPYLLLNFLGAGLACLASVLLHYIPFVILEACWTLVSAMGLIQFFKKK